MTAGVAPRIARYAYIAALLITAATAGAHWLPKLWASTLPLTSRIAADEGGIWRAVPVPHYSNLNVAVHRNVAWCMCSGLGVIAPIPSMDLDSAIPQKWAVAYTMQQAHIRLRFARYLAFTELYARHIHLSRAAFTS